MSIKDTPFGEVDAFNTVIEIPAGSTTKYEYDEESDEMKPELVFKDGFCFPFNYGFVPQTHGGDGDCLDIILIHPSPIEMGTIIKARAIGILELIDNGEVDDKIIAVPVEGGEYNDMDDLPKEWFDEFNKFFKELSVQQNKVMEVKGFHGKEKAIEAIKTSRTNAN